jgi:hypothetical protein
MVAPEMIDTSKSLAELTGVDWGAAPEGVATLVRERHEIRRTPLRELPEEAIVRFLDMGCDAPILVPVALERLQADSEQVGLLCAVLRAEHFDWRGHPDLIAIVRDRVDTVLNQISQITEDLERLHYEAAVWRFCALFERGLSVAELGAPPSGGPAERFGNSADDGGPPSVS